MLVSPWGSGVLDAPDFYPPGFIVREKNWIAVKYFLSQFRPMSRLQLDLARTDEEKRNTAEGAL
jgi:hypothetical protein